VAENEQSTGHALKVLDVKPQPCSKAKIKVLVAIQEQPVVSIVIGLCFPYFLHFVVIDFAFAVDFASVIINLAKIMGPLHFDHGAVAF
ncbi:hypothetical protein U1Q18_047913, partial [Sarracenia purpurea var. burkii]